MAKITAITVKNFTKRLDTAIASSLKSQDLIQQAIVFALGYYANTANALYLSALFQKTEGNKINSAIHSYIMKHANVTLGADKNGLSIYRISDKAKAAKVQPIEAAWYVTSAKVGAPKAAQPIDKQLASAFARLAKTGNEGMIVAELLTEYVASAAFLKAKQIKTAELLEEHKKEVNKLERVAKAA